MQILVRIMLIVAGAIHLLPLPGAFGARRLGRLYALDFSEPNLLIMMRHRAILFGLLGGFMIYAAALRPDLVWIAITGGMISAAGFVWLAWSVGGYNAAITRVVVADCLAIACLAVAFFGQIFSR